MQQLCWLIPEFLRQYYLCQWELHFDSRSNPEGIISLSVKGPASHVLMIKWISNLPNTNLSWICQQLMLYKVWLHGAIKIYLKLTSWLAALFIKYCTKIVRTLGQRSLNPSFSKDNPLDEPVGSSVRMLVHHRNYITFKLDNCLCILY